MKINKIIALFFLVFALCAYSKDNETKSKNCHFIWNEMSCLSQNGKSFDMEGYENSDLINLSGQEKDRLELIDNFYRIQKEILFHNQLTGLFFSDQMLQISF